MKPLDNNTAAMAFDTMRRHLAEAAVDMFQAYGLTVRLAGSSQEPVTTPVGASCAAIIGYAGEKVRGALVMIAANTAIQSWLSVLEGTDAHGNPCCDALGEFSNMLLGRLKARLLPEGFPILLSTPTTAFGAGFTLAPSAGTSAWLSFDGPGWDFSVRIDATFDEGFALQDVADRETAAQAGEMLLF
jgi:CheY-specific phosphatase CheX